MKAAKSKRTLSSAYSCVPNALPPWKQDKKRVFNGRWQTALFPGPKFGKQQKCAVPRFYSKATHPRNNVRLVRGNCLHSLNNNIEFSVQECLHEQFSKIFSISKTFNRSRTMKQLFFQPALNANFTWISCATKILANVLFSCCMKGWGTFAI